MAGMAHDAINDPFMSHDVPRLEAPAPARELQPVVPPQQAAAFWDSEASSKASRGYPPPAYQQNSRYPQRQYQMQPQQQYQHGPQQQYQQRDLYGPRVLVSILRGVGLRGPGVRGAADPYCEFLIPQKNVRFITKTVYNKTSPVWNLVNREVPYSPGDMFQFRVFSKDFEQPRDVLLGEVALRSEQFYPRGYSGNLSLTLQGSQVRGQINVKIQVLQPGQTPTGGYGDKDCCGPLGCCMCCGRVSGCCLPEGCCACCGRWSDCCAPGGFCSCCRSLCWCCGPEGCCGAREGHAHSHEGDGRGCCGTMGGMGSFRDWFGVGDMDRDDKGKYILALVPLMVFVLVLLLWWVLKHYSPTGCVLVSCFILIACVIMGVVGIYFPHKIEVVPLITLAGMCALAVVLGVVVGRLGWDNAWRQYWWSQTGVRYEDTAASTPGPARVDAFSVGFNTAATGTSVDSSRSAGYRDGSVYCAAPVLDPVLAGQTNILVEYWAIGIDCCENSGYFECGGGRGGSYGVKVLDDGYPCAGCHKEDFRSAVSKAEGLFGLVSAPGALMLVWVGSPGQIISKYMTRCLIWGLVSLGLACLFFGALGAFVNYKGIGRKHEYAGETLSREPGGKVDIRPQKPRGQQDYVEDPRRRPGPEQGRTPSPLRRPPSPRQRSLSPSDSRRPAYGEGRPISPPSPRPMEPLGPSRPPYEGSYRPPYEESFRPTGSTRQTF